MAKRKGKALARRRGGRIKRSRRGAAHRGILPAVAGLGFVGIFLANDYGGTGTTPIASLTAGNWQGAFYSLSKNVTSTGVLQVLFPALLVLAGLLWLDRKFGARTRASRKWNLI